ncbi:MAG: 3-methyladenine glycosylase 2 [Frondihabitans sp.]|nr:3-methyladenine glycosylase 2 [Frondihabitans sp.]
MDSGVHPVNVELHDDAVILSCEAEDPATVTDLVIAVRSWLDLDTDLTDMTVSFGADPFLAPLVEAHPGLRIPSYPISSPSGQWRTPTHLRRAT